MLNSYAEIEIMMNAKVMTALNNSTERILARLQNFILDEVYVGTPSMYDRSYDFLDSWMRSLSVLKGSIMESSVFQDWKSMSFNPSKYQHGSYEWKDGTSDFREFLAVTLNEGTSGNLFGNEGSWLLPAPYWTKFTEWLNGNIFTIFQEEMIKVGIPISSGITAIFN